MIEKLLWLDENKRKLSFNDKFSPAALWNRHFRNEVEQKESSIPITIAIVKDKEPIVVYRTKIFSDDSEFYNLNYYYIERIIKTLLWVYGGNIILISGSNNIYKYIKKQYCQEGKRSFDVNFMSKIYEKEFTVECIDTQSILVSKEEPVKLGGFFNGCRIGFDLGASDRKVSAVIDGKIVFSEEILWNPSSQLDPSYHYNEIMSMLHRAASYMPRVDAIGGSSAGIFINNRVMSASIFRSVPQHIFNKKIKNIFINIQRKWKVPLKVINDGKVAALASSIYLKKNSILAIALGSSEVGGYIDSNGKIGPGIDELAFIPIDFSPSAPIDEWSGDIGCGGQYLSQVGAIRFAGKAGIIFSKGELPAKMLITIQELLKKGDERARKVFKAIGYYFGYAISYYSDFYSIGSVLILGRVTSGGGGKIILDEARKVLKKDFPELATKVEIFLPDESNRRMGQSIAAASLPEIDNLSG